LLFAKLHDFLIPAIGDLFQRQNVRPVDLKLFCRYRSGPFAMAPATGRKLVIRHLAPPPASEERRCSAAAERSPFRACRTVVSRRLASFSLTSLWRKTFTTENH
jgi:hypothetical protein